MSFNNLIGNQKVKNLLITTLNNKRVSHSYIFSGIEGIGKYLFAKEFAKSILCVNDIACDNCKSCLEFDNDNHPDYSEIQIIDGNTIKIDQIREMQEKIIEKPIISNKKVYIINNAEAMVPQAQNCLLKTLEEPPEYVTIILVTANEGKLLTTIKSRCIKINFEPIDNESLKEYLDKNDLETSDELMQIYEGSIKRAIDLKDKKDIYKDIYNKFSNINKFDVLDILGKFDSLYKQKSIIYDLLDYINLIFFDKIKYDNNYLKYIDYIEEAKRSLHANANYDMTIDRLILNIWEG